MRNLFFALILLFSIVGCGGNPTTKIVELGNTQTRATIDNNKTENSSDNRAPTISLVGSSTMEIELGETFNDPGAVANDAEDGDITPNIKVTGSVDTHREGNYTLTYSVTDSGGKAAQVRRTVIVKQVDIATPAKDFDDIKALFRASKNGLIEKVTYIVVGDSTRAVSVKNNSQRYFNHLEQAFERFSVDAILMARGSHELRQFLDATAHPTVDEVIEKIPNDGETTVIDLSLGVNDFLALNQERVDNNLGGFSKNRARFKQVIKERLLKAIDEIRVARPKTTIMLVTPNPFKKWEDATDLMVEIYKEVADEKHLPLADFVDDEMHGAKTTEEGDYDEWYRDGIHFSDKALDILSNYIAGKILPE